MSPPALPGPSVRRVMGLVLLALLPGVLAQIARFGVALALRLLLAIACALAVEAIALRCRRRDLRPFLTDLSAPVAAVLLVLALPFAIPWWLTCIGIIAALAIGKHMYGGLGDNVFNPAMFGCALLLAGFPAYLQAAPTTVDPTSGLPWVPMMYALGGLFLLWKKIIRWHAPALMLAGALATHLLYPSLAEATWKGADPFAGLSPPIVLGAFFIVTDPVTGCLS
ncbi:MAG: RnfABCDGE type electron transport complex subunit D, partial [Arenimonas sp.]